MRERDTHLLDQIIYDLEIFEQRNKTSCELEDSREDSREEQERRLNEYFKGDL